MNTTATHGPAAPSANSISGNGSATQGPDPIDALQKDIELVVRSHEEGQIDDTRYDLEIARLANQHHVLINVIRKACATETKKYRAHVSSITGTSDLTAAERQERRVRGSVLRTVITTRISSPGDTVRDFAVVPEMLD